ncbi:MAG: hypothetical protein IE891_06915 [Flavobacteriaceae bacterium]|nr:hypothetical protein [Flavobacteriaceae bacterium]
MKTKKLFFVLLFVVALSSFVGVHKFYVSVTQIDFNQKKSRIEFTTRIFIDDLEKALDKKYNTKLNLATKQESEKSKEYIEKYLFEKMSISINNKTRKLVFLGSEYDNDVLICYLKVDCSEKIATLGVYNSILTELFSEQQNIVHTNINSVKKSYLLTQTDKETRIDY